MQIFILNGGLGKRVKKISLNKPKCLIEFNNKPFLYYQLNLLKKNGFKDIVLCLGYKSNQILKYLKINHKLYKNIRWSKESKKLDTGGALINSKKLMNNFFFVTFGDSYLDIDYKKILKLFNQKNKYSALITVIKKEKVPYHKPNLIIKKNKLIGYSNGKNSNFIDYGLMIFNKSIFKNYSLKKITLKTIIKKLIKDNSVRFIMIDKKFNEIGSTHGIEDFKKIINK
tara:strand:+ start:623 stop:1303 length:681 start_codon:yes stop_codon:yes gene_type:complete